VELVPDQKEYRAGETARILVKSPFPEAEALVTVERLGVVRAERVRLEGATPVVNVKVTDDLRPNAFVAVHLIRARGKKKEDAVGASYRMGYAELRVDPELRRLGVSVKPSASDFRPGSEVSVDLFVSDREGRGKASELTVFAVDEGVLSLTGYETPDPIPVFTASRPLAVATLETRDALAKVGLTQLEHLLGADKGGDGGGGSEDSGRSVFRQTVFFDPDVRTDAKGRATVRFELPDGLTTYRIMAIALGTICPHADSDFTVVLGRKGLVRHDIGVRVAHTFWDTPGNQIVAGDIDQGRDLGIEQGDVDELAFACTLGVMQCG
jgi:uncharacterized protein YfaS (alpha-2-macroglobulin family)